MKKFLKIVAFVFCMSFLGFTNVQAAQNSDVIRVGLESSFNSVSSIPVFNTGIRVGINLNGENMAITDLISLNGFTVNADHSFYVNTGDFFTDYQNAYRKALDYRLQGYNASPVLLGYGHFGIYIGGYQSLNEALTVANMGEGFSVIQPSSYMVNIKADAETVLISNFEGFYPVLWDINGNPVNLGERSYRGSIEFNRRAGGITAINIIDIESYLYSVVPSEMPSTWHSEALKAQAVAARSYTYTRMGVHSHNGYDICDGIHCQVYNGFGNETESSIKAVEDTRGIAAYHNDQIINATYFSSSGGFTENSEDIWLNELPYLRAIQDIYESEYMQWTRTFTMDEITALLIARDIQIGSAQSVTINTGANGRVMQLIINGTNGTHTVEKDSVRTFFSLAAGGSLQSRNFIITEGENTAAGIYPEQGPLIDSSEDNALPNPIAAIGASGNFITDRGLITIQGGESADIFDMPVIENNHDGSVINNTIPLAENSFRTYTSSGNSVTFSGKGWGHGVGMSQYGAKGMAEAGYTFDQILNFYYTNITVR